MCRNKELIGASLRQFVRPFVRGFIYLSLRLSVRPCIRLSVCFLVVRCWSDLPLACPFVRPPLAIQRPDLLEEALKGIWTGPLFFSEAWLGRQLRLRTLNSKPEAKPTPKP